MKSIVKFFIWAICVIVGALIQVGLTYAGFPLPQLLPVLAVGVAAFAAISLCRLFEKHYDANHPSNDEQKNEDNQNN